MTDLSGFRKEYIGNVLLESQMESNPMLQFEQWMEDAIRFGMPEPNAMILATSTPEGKPSARCVLLKESNERGFVFFTNYRSRKGMELNANPFAALVFDWHEMERQIRIEGHVEKLSDEESDLYFHSRPVSSQIGTWASPQSQIIEDRETLDNSFRQYEKKLIDYRPIPRPSHWGGFIVIPHLIEFWQGRPNRLHDRIAYYRNKEIWQMNRLAP
ncbi:MAG TPA: pyridoxamine 5'-phosphate oxidase [Dysgonamonadaceae bacterium]|nr:pyridoxamine 5'-phosphate oxidase [Dysgonamonadaceae bacterium]HQI43402.1 pyridoxamine 5'-phosphate oxidase [Dysgonamonadaceae bacterium]